MTHRTEIKRRVLREIESMPDADLYDVLNGALEPGWLASMALEYLRPALAGRSIEAIHEQLALDEPSQDEIDEEEGRYYDRQRA